MNPANLALEPAAAPSSAASDRAPRSTRRLTGPSALSALPGVALTAAVDDERSRRVVDHWPYEARALAESLGWPDGEYVARQRGREATLFLSAPMDGLDTAAEVAAIAWQRAEAYVATQDGDVRVLADPRAGLRARAAGEFAARARVRAMIEAAVRYGVSWQLANETLTVGRGSGSVSWPTAAVPSVDGVAWERCDDVPTVLTLGEPCARDIGALATMLLRAAGIGAAFGSRPGEASELVRDREVGALVLKVAGEVLERDVLPVPRADVVVLSSVPSEEADAMHAVSRLVGPLGRVVCNADAPALVALARTWRAPVVWYSTDAENLTVLEGVAAWGDGAAVVQGHLMLAHDGVWCDAGRVDRLAPGTDAGAALAAALAALCVGVPLARIVAALPA